MLVHVTVQCNYFLYCIDEYKGDIACDIETYNRVKQDINKEQLKLTFQY